MTAPANAKFKKARSFEPGFTHLTNTVKPDGTIGTLNGWHNIETQLKYQLYVPS